MPRGPEVRPAAERFALKYEIDPLTGCHLWLGATDGRGYGHFYVDRQRQHEKAYRYAWAVKHGRYPYPHLELDHLCRTPRCVNADHLEEVTHKVNMQRAMRPDCPQGHPYSGDNLVIKADGTRDCRACKIVQDRAYYDGLDPERKRALLESYAARRRERIATETAEETQRRKARQAENARRLRNADPETSNAKQRAYRANNDYNAKQREYRARKKAERMAAEQDQ